LIGSGKKYRSGRNPINLKNKQYNGSKENKEEGSEEDGKEKEPRIVFKNTSRKRGVFLLKQIKIFVIMW
jgi:hypothetical protein